MTKKLFSPKNLIIVVLLTVIAVLVALVGTLYGKLSVFRMYISPYDYLKMKTPLNDTELTPVEPVYQGIADNKIDNIYVVFYANKHGTYDCALLEKNSSGYDIILRSGHFAHGDISPWIYSSDLRQEDGTLIELLWGILADDSAKQVLVNNMPCEIANTAFGFRVFWIIGSNNEIYHNKVWYADSGTYSQSFAPTFEIVS